MARRERSRDIFAEIEKKDSSATVAEQLHVDLFYDYEQLPEEHRDSIIRSAMAIKPRLKRAAEDIFVIGQQLILVKERLPYGKYEEWLDIEFGLSVRMAQRFVNVRERLGPRNDNLSLLPPSTLYLLAAPSTPDEAIETVEKALNSGGQRISVSYVQHVINAAKKKNKPVVTIDGEFTVAETVPPDTVKIAKELDFLLGRVQYMIDGKSSDTWSLLFPDDNAWSELQAKIIEMRNRLGSAKE